ncbi:MAG: malonate transporter [Gammaproteobacteria bacterium]|jgi:malonate transporter
MFQVAGLVIPLFGLILLGFIAGKIKRIPVEGLAWLNFFIVYIALPALFFTLLSKTPVSEFANTKFLLNTTLGTFLIFTLCFFIAKAFRKADTPTATIQGFTGAYGNIGYLGPPLAIAAFGPQAGVPVALIICLDNTMHFTLAPALMAIGSKSPTRLRIVVWNIIVKIFTHPFILASIAGMLAAWHQVQLPNAIDQLLMTLTTAAAPCALFALGVTSALRPLKRIPVELSYLVPIKLLVHPLLIYVLVSRIPGVDTVWVHSAVLLAALPSATNVFIIAQQYQVWEERASSAVVVSTLFSVVTVTVYIYMATNDLI